jgi:outer membrane protein assembly factor BamB
LKNIFIITLLSLLFSSCAMIKERGVEAPVRKEKVFHLTWVKNLDPEYETGNMPIGLASPLIHEDVVYAGNSRGAFEAYSAENGRLLWQDKTQGGMNSAPVTYKDLLIFGDNHGRVYAKKLGELEYAYQFDVGSPLDSTPVVSNDRIFIHTRNHKIFCADAMTGKILWTYKRSVPYFSTLQRTSRPLVVANRVYVGFADGNLLAFSLEDGQLLWEKRVGTATKFVDVDMKPNLFAGRIVVGTNYGEVEVIDAQRGTLYKKIPFSSSRRGLVVGSELVFGTTKGKIVSIDRSYNIIKDIKVTDYAISSISKWKDGFVVTTIGPKVLYLDDKFNVIDEFDLGTKYSAVFGSTSIAGDMLAVYSSRNRLYLFK